MFDFSAFGVVLTRELCDQYAFELLEYFKSLTIILTTETLSKGYAQKGHRKSNTNLS